MNHATIVRIFFIASSITLASPITCMNKKKEKEQKHLEKTIKSFLNRYPCSSFSIHQPKETLTEKEIKPDLILEEDDLMKSLLKIESTYNVIKAMKNYTTILRSRAEKEKRAIEKLQPNKEIISEKDIEEFPIKKLVDHRPFTTAMKNGLLSPQGLDHSRKINIMSNSFDWFNTVISSYKSLEVKKHKKTLIKLALKEFELAKYFEKVWKNEIKIQIIQVKDDEKDFKKELARTGEKRDIERWINSIIKTGENALIEMGLSIYPKDVRR